jgi:hypothetical protein
MVAELDWVPENLTVKGDACSALLITAIQIKLASVNPTRIR